MLDKKEVEGEGWKASQHFPNVFMRYDNEWCYGLWLLDDDKIHISKSKPNGQPNGETYTLYEGECKDINTFREICKPYKFVGKWVVPESMFTYQSNS